MPSAITEQNTGGVERLDIAGSCLTGRGPNFAHIVRSSLLINICSTPNPILRQRQPSEEGRFCLLLRPLWIGFDTLWTPRQESSCWRRHCTVSLLCCRRNEQPDAPLAVSSRPRSGEPRLKWHAERGNHHGLIATTPSFGLEVTFHHMRYGRAISLETSPSAACLSLGSNGSGCFPEIDPAS